MKCLPLFLFRVNHETRIKFQNYICWIIGNIETHFTPSSGSCCNEVIKTEKKSFASFTSFPLIKAQCLWRFKRNYRWIDKERTGGGKVGEQELRYTVFPTIKLALTIPHFQLASYLNWGGGLGRDEWKIPVKQIELHQSVHRQRWNAGPVETNWENYLFNCLVCLFFRETCGDNSFNYFWDTLYWNLQFIGKFQFY